MSTRTRKSASVKQQQPKKLYSREKAAILGQQGKFLRVGGRQATARKISNAPANWRGSSKKPADNDIYVQEYFIAGPQNEVYYELRDDGVPEDRIRQAIANAITRDNWEQRQADVERLRAIEDRAPKIRTGTRGTALKKTSRYSFEEAMRIFEAARDPKNVEWVPVERTVTHRTRAPAAPRQKESLADRARKYENHPTQAIDVSQMATDGSNVRVAKIPAANSRSVKVYVPGLPFISDNLERFKEAVSLVYGHSKMVSYENAIRDAFFQKFESRMSRSKSVKHSTKSARKSKAKKGSSSKKGTRKAATKRSLPRLGELPSTTGTTGTTGRTSTRAASPSRRAASPKRAASPTSRTSARTSARALPTLPAAGGFGTGFGSTFLPPRGAVARVASPVDMFRTQV